MILGVLTAFIIVALNPLKQIQKSQDAQREHDLKQLNSAVDSFYNDTNCYPDLSVIPNSGDAWKDANSQVYMQKVPGDPAVFGGWQNYAYVTDKTNCHQWNVFFAKVADDSMSLSTRCPLETMKDSSGNDCKPKNLDKTQNNPNPRYNYCVLSGNIDCGVISELDLNSATDVPALGVTSSGGSGQQATATPTPTPGGGGSGQTYTCPQNGGTYPCSCSDVSWQQDSGGQCNHHTPGDPIAPGATGVCCTTGSGANFACDTSHACN